MLLGLRMYELGGRVGGGVSSDCDFYRVVIELQNDQLQTSAMVIGLCCKPRLIRTEKCVEQFDRDATLQRFRGWCYVEIGWVLLV